MKRTMCDEVLESMDALRPLRHLSHPREAIRQFTPSFFAIAMGTGILALMLGQFPTSSPVPLEIGRCLWFFNILLFGLCTLAFTARTLFFPETLSRLLRHPTQSLFLGTIPMALATVVNGCVVYGMPLFGDAAIAIGYRLWLLDCLLAILIGVIVPALMFSAQKHALDTISALWLLPIVPAEVAAGSGAWLLPHLSGTIAPNVFVACLILWGFSVPLALGILIMLILRMALYRLPPKELAISNWLTLGPLGTGALAVLLLGSAAPRILIAQPLMAACAQTISLFIGLVLWGYGSWWMVIALLTTVHHIRSRIPFNMGWWGLVFPLGVYTSATYALGHILHGVFFITTAAICTILLVLFWLLVFVRTVTGIWDGQIFFAPCLVDAIGVDPIAE